MPLVMSDPTDNRGRARTDETCGLRVVDDLERTDSGDDALVLPPRTDPTFPSIAERSQPCRTHDPIDLLSANSLHHSVGRARRP
jgi:hypothetical protein